MNGLGRHRAGRAQSWSSADNDIRTWVDGIIAALQAELESQLVGVYLHGSLAMGSYYRPKSDLDLLVVVKHGLSSDARGRLAKLFLGEYDRRPTTGGLESSIVTAEAAANFVHPMPYEVHFSSSWAERVRQDDVDYAEDRTDPDLAAHAAVTRARGIALFGPPPEQVFGAVPWRDYVASISDDFEWIVSGDNILTTPFYGVLNACRVLMVLERGEDCVPSKDEAGEWALRELSSPQRLMVGQALACYRDGSAIDETGRQTHGHGWDEAALRSFAVYAKGRALVARGDGMGQRAR